MIRVVLPHHLRTLAGVDGEVSLDAQERPTQRAVLDALEATYPVLRGTIRDQGTASGARSSASSPADRTSRSSPPDEPLPDEVASGERTFRVVGAMAGG